MSKERVHRNNGKYVSKKERRRRQICAERKFKKALGKTFLKVNPNPPSIRCDENPVKNSNGNGYKKVTHPDLFVIDPRGNRGMHVEVAYGNEDTDHKLAQRRVVEAAGVENYFVVTGDHIQQLEESSSPEKILEIVFGWFEWEQEESVYEG